MFKKNKQKTNKTIAIDRYFRFETECAKIISNEFLLAWFKFQVKIRSHFGGMRLRRVAKIDPFIPPTSGDKGLKSTLDIA